MRERRAGKWGWRRRWRRFGWSRGGVGFRLERGGREGVERNSC
jgi:hypothetical protein